MISVIIPAHDEAAFIGGCLERLLASDLPGAQGVEVIVAANGCTDDTAERAARWQADFAARGWRLVVLVDSIANKIKALNMAEAVATGAIRVYVDADVHVTTGLIALLAAALDRPDPAYASGRPDIRVPRSAASRRYARFWMRLPFMSRDVPGCGIYAVNAAGRQRWQQFPDIMADDIFVRMHFARSERIAVPAQYSWPIAEGFGWLVKVRRRQNSGLRQLYVAFPDLVRRSDSTRPKPLELLQLLARDPVGFGVYSAVAVLVKLPFLRARERWPRGR
ncbi:Glycosyltransferase involved in cell wall bisynthesis [Roseicitreum antarcticum]|uniref:Glycosyltransferase involved in cell wall bisynthesis n=2 Tax=Roseicitreum antarcticum TaxID=564137 RepID=A0A1H2UMI5_9RHOB|nr:Glycosyltransferase involved in cell wall bisynthesis [Roseicitreum antarcticum]